jgi:hypothetical protein
MLPDTVVPGSDRVGWLDGERLVLPRARHDHPDFPASISVIGDTEEGADCLTMHYCDSRGVSRVYRLSAEEGDLRNWRYRGVSASASPAVSLTTAAHSAARSR